MTTDQKPRRDLFQEVTDKIIAALEQSNGESRWQRPWSVLAEHGLPQNGITGRHYGGINVLLLAMEAEQRGFDDSRYMTFKQASEAGFKIRKGAKSIPVYFFKKLEVEERDPQGEPTKKNIPYLTEYRVFNAQDIEGLEPINNPPPKWQPIDVMEKIVKKLGVNVQYGGICALPVASICDDDCMLFMWVPSSRLKDGLDVMDAWGFEYVTQAVWHKNGQQGRADYLGGVFYQGHESILVGRRGNGLPAPETKNKFSSVIEAPRTEHSKKPEKVYDMLEKMYPDFKGNFCELFARNTREGWLSWGNEVACPEQEETV